MSYTLKVLGSAFSIPNVEKVRSGTDKSPPLPALHPLPDLEDAMTAPSTSYNWLVAEVPGERRYVRYDRDTTAVLLNRWGKVDQTV